MQNVANAAVNVNVSVSRKMRCFVFRTCWSNVFNFFFCFPFLLSSLWSHDFLFVLLFIFLLNVQTSFSPFRNMIFHSLFFLSFFIECVRFFRPRKVYTDMFQVDIQHRDSLDFLVFLHILFDRYIFIWSGCVAKYKSPSFILFKGGSSTERERVKTGEKALNEFYKRMRTIELYRHAQHLSTEERERRQSKYFWRK